MNALIRWVKFNIVGALGAAVQLGALALLNRLMAGHYLLASAAAVELTLLHNFAGHCLYTWRDRSRIRKAASFVRFQVSAGTISICGNLVLMRWFVGGFRMPVVAANLAAILCCSLANFLAANKWAFKCGNGCSTVICSSRNDCRSQKLSPINERGDSGRPFYAGPEC